MFSFLFVTTFHIRRIHAAGIKNGVFSHGNTVFMEAYGRKTVRVIYLILPDVCRAPFCTAFSSLPNTPPLTIYSSSSPSCSPGLSSFSICSFVPNHDNASIRILSSKLAIPICSAASRIYPLSSSWR